VDEPPDQHEEDEADPAEDLVPVVVEGVEEIQNVKKGCRSVIASLVFTLARMLVVWLVYYVVSRIAMMPTRTLEGVTSPREYFSGKQPDMQRELQLEFMERVEVHQRTTNTMQARTRPGLALVSVGNEYGSWKVLMLDTMKVASMDAWTALPMDTGTITAMEALAKSNFPVPSDPEFRMSNRIVELGVSVNYELRMSQTTTLRKRSPRTMASW
jgi:hypothetical protein